MFFLTLYVIWVSFSTIHTISLKGQHGITMYRTMTLNVYYLMEI